MAKQTEAPDMFKTAQKLEQKSPSGSKAKLQIRRLGLEEKLLEYAKQKAAEANAKSAKEMIGGELKEVGVEEWMNLYRKNQTRPDSFQLVDGAGKVLVIVEDKYKKVEEAKEQALKDYDVIETKQTYIINPELLEVWGKRISQAIWSIKEMPVEVKQQLIQCQEVKSVKKGTIDRLLTYDRPEELFALIEPIIALK